MSMTDHAMVPLAGARAPVAADARAALEAFWAHAELGVLKAKFAVAREMAILPRLPIQALRAIALQYRYFTQAFVTDLARLIVRCPESRLRSLLGQLVDEELGEGDPELAHLRLYDRFLASIGAIDDHEPLATRIHPRVRELIGALSERTQQRSLYYAIGMRGLGGECVCGVYFSVMNVHLRQHPFVVEHAQRIDWRFWDIHAGDADEQHNQLVRAAVAEILLDGTSDAIAEVSAGFAYGTQVWDEFWSTLYADHAGPLVAAER